MDKVFPRLDLVFKRHFWFFLGLCLILAFTLRVRPLLTNNFHFTMDQGDDAVHVREILERGQILLVGPETNFAGLFTGPLWYYFAAAGYGLFGGHPGGVVMLLIILSLATMAAAAWKLREKVGPGAGLTVAAGLTVFWWFYDVSRYGFNPFPLVFLSFGVIFLLLDVWEGKRGRFLWAAVLVGLSFHTELAGAFALAVFYFLTGVVFLRRRLVSIKGFLLAIVLVFLFFTANIIYDFQNDFSQFWALRRMVLGEERVFGQSQLGRIGAEFLVMAGNSVFPQKGVVGLAGFLLVLLLFWKKNGFFLKDFTSRFVVLVLGYTALSFLVFGSNTGWRIWHTVALPPLLFGAILLMVASLPKPARYALLFFILGAQAVFFVGLYRHFLEPISDQSILKNELAAIDRVYQEAGGEGFYVYNYLPSVRDYSHQYLFWWYGKKKYGYLPCEYGRYPGVPAFFVPGHEYYQSPKKACANLRFLIMEPDDNSFIKERWISGVTAKTRLLRAWKIGEIRVEKREREE